MIARDLLANLTAGGKGEFELPPEFLRIFAAMAAGGFVDPAISGAYLATVIARYLDGSLDIASTRIVIGTAMQINVNLDVAAAQGIGIEDELVAMADIVLRDGVAASRRARAVLTRLDMSDAEIEIALGPHP